MPHPPFHALFFAESKKKQMQFLAFAADDNPRR
jgi:hypothetical protein